MPTFDDLHQALSTARAAIGAAEVHGLLSALACAPGDSRLAVVHGEVLGEAAAHPHYAGCRDTLAETWAATRAALRTGEYAFEPLLPDDDAPLSERTLALGAWCAGYLAGLGLAGVQLHDKAFSGEAGEFLHDLTEMSQIEPDGDDHDEASETAYMELVEYVRVGVILLSEELDGGGDEQRPRVGRLH